MYRNGELVGNKADFDCNNGTWNNVGDSQEQSSVTFTGAKNPGELVECAKKFAIAFFRIEGSEPGKKDDIRLDLSGHKASATVLLKNP